MASSVVIVGRPNVGKSTLFNRLAGKRLALVDDRPGMTRDRREGSARLGDLAFTIVDTAGLEVGEEASLTARMRAQTEAAIEAGDAILFVVDARAGLTPADRHFGRLVRRAGKPVVLVANKAEGRIAESAPYEFFELGLGNPVPISAEHGEGMADLYDALQAILPGEGEAAHGPAAEEGSRGAMRPAPEAQDEGADPSKPLRIAIIGRPNVGKSTLLNRILGEERLLTGPEAGITRDAIAVETVWRERKLKFFDTAGMRRRARVTDSVERLAVADALRAVRFAEVVVVLLDATIPFEKQDLALVDLVAQEGRALVIGLNKWDLIEGKDAKLAELRDTAERMLPQVRGAPVVPVSGAIGMGIERLMEAIFSAFEVWNTRVSTGRLNRWLAPLVDATPPPAVSGRRIKLRYITQAKARPPHFVIFGNQLSQLPESYVRFLVNDLRRSFHLPGVPIRITLKQGKNPFAEAD